MQPVRKRGRLENFRQLEGGCALSVLFELADLVPTENHGPDDGQHTEDLCILRGSLKVHGPPWMSKP